MSARALAWAQGQDAGGFGAKLALVLLADWANDEGLVFASLGRLADRMPTTDAAVVRYVRALLGAGLLRPGPVEVRDAQAKAQGVSPEAFGTPYVLALEHGPRQGFDTAGLWPTSTTGEMNAGLPSGFWGGEVG